MEYDLKPVYKRYLMLGIPTIALITLLVFSLIITTASVPTTTSIVSVSPFVEPLSIKADYCISTDGDFEGRKTPAHQGIVEEVSCNNALINDPSKYLLTNTGRNAIRDMIGQGINFSSFVYIGLCNSSGACNDPAVGDTALTNEHTAFGLGRAAGTYGVLTGSGNWSVAKTFTCSATTSTNKTALFNQSSVTGGTMLFAGTFTGVSCIASDQITVNITACAGC